MADPAYAEMVHLYNESASKSAALALDLVDYEELGRFFHSKGIQGLNNGLSEEDNHRLFETPFIPEMIALLLKGLTMLSKQGQQ